MQQKTFPNNLFIGFLSYNEILHFSSLSLVYTVTKSNKTNKSKNPKWMYSYVTTI